MREIVIPGRGWNPPSLVASLGQRWRIAEAPLPDFTLDAKCQEYCAGFIRYDPISKQHFSLAASGSSTDSGCEYITD